MGFDYGSIYYGATMAQEIFGMGLLLVVLGIYLLTFGFSVIVYVLQSIGLHTIANRRGIRKGWLAWIPIGTLWIIGSISDQYQYVVKGRVCNRRKALVWLSIVQIVVPTALAVIAGLTASEYVSASAVQGSALPSLLASIGITLLVSVLAIIIMVIEYIAIYDLFVSCDPGNGVLMLVLSIIFNVTLPFFIFAMRKRDAGMPPRKSTVQPVQVVEESPQVCEAVPQIEEAVTSEET